MVLRLPSTNLQAARQHLDRELFKQAYVKCGGNWRAMRQYLGTSFRQLARIRKTFNRQELRHLLLPKYVTAPTRILDFTDIKP